MIDLEVHRYAKIKLPASEHTLEKMTESIRHAGILIKPIKYRGKLLDGRNRCEAANRAGVDVEFEQFVPKHFATCNTADDAPDCVECDDEALMFVMDIHSRMNLDDAQLALMAQRAEALQKENRKRRKLLGQVRVGKVQRELPKMDNDVESMLDEVQENGVPELVEALELGDVNAPRAAMISRMEPEEQRALLEKAAQPVETKRAKSEAAEQMTSVSVKHTPVECAAIKAAYHWAGKSIHGELRAFASLMKEVWPWVK